MVFILIRQVLIMFLLMAVGFVLYRKGKINSEGTGQLSFLVLYISTPVLILESMTTPFVQEKLIKGIWTFVVSLLIILLSALIARMIFKKEKSVTQFAMIFSNTGFLGIPLVRSVLGSEAVFYISVYILSLNLLLWTYGVYLISHDKRNISVKKLLLNPTLLAIVAGLVLFVSGWRFPSIVEEAYGYLSAMNTGMAMLVLGVYLGETKLLEVIRQKEIWVICFLRLIAVPLMSVILLTLLPIAMDIKTVLLIGSCTPCAGALPMFCQQYGGEYRLGAGAVGISTLLSLLTMPIFVQLLNMMAVL